MPEQRFVVRWPDGSVEECYSPSTIVRDYLTAGDSYPLDGFHDRALAALNAANERVRARFGMGCSQALQQIAHIRMRTAQFADRPDGLVTVETFLP